MSIDKQNAMWCKYILYKSHKGKTTNMATYTTEQLLTSVLSTEFYSAETIDEALSSLSGDIDAIVDKISTEINPRLSSIADAVSVHIQAVDTLSTNVDTIVSNVDSLSTAIEGLTELSALSNDVTDLKAINAQLSGITTLATDGSVSILSVIGKVNEIIAKFTKQS